MSEIMDSIRARAAKLNRHIVLPEGNDERTIRAAAAIVERKMARITVLGNEAEMKKMCPDVKFGGFDIIDPATSDKLNAYADLLYELRKAKGMTREDAQKIAADPLYYGTLMLKADDADGMVAGAINSTGAVLRPALQIIKTAPGIGSASSCFIIALPKENPASKLYGENGVLVYGDCGVIPNPTEDQMVDIAYSTAKTARDVCGFADPRVALLSFSTKGSAKDPLVDKVTGALEKIKAKYPDMKVDGELQGDAALVSRVAQKKVKGDSPVAGKANVLIFPDLNAGNIAYKLSQYLGGAEAIGPLIQGLAKPVNDLSRGCNVEDIISVVAVVILNTQH